MIETKIIEYFAIFPSLSVNPVDVAGAGDSLLAVMAIGLSSNQSMMGTSSLACCMASLAVEKMGNNPIGADALKELLRNSLVNYEEDLSNRQ